MRSRSLQLAGIVAALLLAAGGAAMWLHGSTRPPAPAELMEALSRAGVTRGFGPRLSIQVEYRTCRQVYGPDPGVPMTECPADTPSARLRRTVGRAKARVRQGADPTAMHVVALGDLLSAGDPALERAISVLQSVALLTDAPADALSDLAAAHLVRAERRQSPRNLLEAVEAASRALEADSGHPAARWNLAYALTRLGVDGEASRAWAAYRAVDSVSGWGRESGRWAGGLAAARTSGRGVSPQEEAARGWIGELGAWADAVQRGDYAGAEAHLRAAEMIGSALERGGRDATLADAVRFIRVHEHSRQQLRPLAEAHRDYARGRALYDAGNRREAAPWLERAASSPAASPALREWASLFHAATLVYGGRKAAGERVMRGVAAGCDTLRAAALAGRAYWMLGTTLNQAGHLEGARAAYETAARFLARAGESENEGTVQYLKGEVEFAAGNALGGYEQAYRALRTLRPYRASRWLHNQLQVAATASAAAGLPRTAILLQNESLEVGRRTGIPIYAVEALLARAQLLSAAGRTVEARADVDSARTRIAGLAPEEKAWAEADLRLAEARLVGETAPRRAADALDRVVASPASTQTVQREAAARLARADALLRIGDPTAAAADLERVIYLVDSLRAVARSGSLRASLADLARGVFDRMVMLQVNTSSPERALAYLERGREAFAPLGRGAGTAATLPLPRGGEAGIEYALIGDTLLSWVVDRTGVRLTRTSVDRERLLQTTRRVSAALQAEADEESVAEDLAFLYGLLMRPLRGLPDGPGAEIVIVADGEIAAIPFAALRDGPKGRYLVQDRTLRFAATLHDAFGTVARSDAPRWRTLVIEPGDAAARAADLSPLPTAAREAASIAAAYPVARIISGDSATPEAVTSAMGQAAVVHYAGHAVFDDERPEQSFLALAPGAGMGGGRLTATDIEMLRLDAVRLVVLSACETQRAQDRRSGGFSGLTAALMRAGAGGVIGTLWKVDDRLASPLVTEFHRAYRTSGDASQALRTAQLRMLASPDAALRSPAAWAAFRYSGS
ncbi:MAG TPA: CHAT domain-containing protein [Longimicrobium sp.]